MEFQYNLIFLLQLDQRPQLDLHSLPDLIPLLDPHLLHLIRPQRLRPLQLLVCSSRGIYGIRGEAEPAAHLSKPLAYLKLLVLLNLLRS